MTHRRSRRIESDSDSDDNNTQLAQSSSPLRRSSRIQRRNSQSSSFDDDEDSDINQQSNNNHNRNSNHSDNDSDVVFDENKNEMEESENDSSDNEQETEEQKITHPDARMFLPSHINQCGDRWNKLGSEIEEIALDRLIDTAQSFAEHNHQTNDYQQQKERLQSAMNKLFELNKEIKIEKVWCSLHSFVQINMKHFEYFS